jgi:hypothetical protein
VSIRFRPVFHRIVDAPHARGDDRAGSLPRHVDRHDRHRADVGVRFDDGREMFAALEDPVFMLVAAEDHIDGGDLLRELLIAGEGQVRDGDQHVELPLDLRDRGLRRADRFAVADPRLLVGVDGEPDQPDPHDTGSRFHRDHGGANIQPLTVDARRAERRRRQVVAAERREEGRIARLHLSAQPRYARQAARPSRLHRRDLINVVEVEDSDSALRAGR